MTRTPRGTKTVVVTIWFCIKCETTAESAKQAKCEGCKTPMTDIGFVEGLEKPEAKKVTDNTNEAHSGSESV